MFCTVITLLLSEARVVALEGCTRPLNSFPGLCLHETEASAQFEKRKIAFRHLEFNVLSALISRCNRHWKGV